MKNFRKSQLIGQSVKIAMALFVVLGWSLQSMAQTPHQGHYYQIVAKHSGKVLDVMGGVEMVQDGVSILQWEGNGGDNQLFRLDEVGGGYYQIIAKHSGKAVDVRGGTCAKQNGNIINQWEAVGASNQLFRLEEKEDGYFQIIAKHSGKALDVYGSNDENGAKLVQYDPTGNDNQLFRFVEAGTEEASPTGVEY